MAAHSPVMRAVRDHAARGGYLLGVCNGFQILTEAGLLPGALLRNASLRFLSMDCHLRVERTDTVFTSHYQRGTGIPRRDGAWRRQLLRRRRDAGPAGRRGPGGVALRDAVRRGRRRKPTATAVPARSPASSVANLRVLGLMPHPEDLVDPLMGGTDGKPLFDALAVA